MNMGAPGEDDSEEVRDARADALAGSQWTSTTQRHVTNDSILSSEVLDLGHTEYVAIGMAKISQSSSFWDRLGQKLSSTKVGGER